MPPNTYPLTPHSTYQPKSIRRIYIQNLTDLLHVCLLRGDCERARRAWAILIRCREVNWRSRWQWGLQLLSTVPPHDGQELALASADPEGRRVERWLGTLRISGKEAEKPALLQATVLHLIKHERYRDALDQLETYLPSYPFLLSGSLHTYAGMLCFYLAQPLSTRVVTAAATGRDTRQTSIDSSNTLASVSKSEDFSDVDTPSVVQEPANPVLMRQARGWFAKALSLDERDDVAAEYIKLIDSPNGHDSDDDHDDHGLERMDDHESKEDEDDEEMEDKYDDVDSDTDAEEDNHSEVLLSDADFG